MEQQSRPFWLPDTQGFLSVAIITLISVITLILLTKPPTIDERTSGVLMTVVGVLIACLKDVYQYFFGSSKGSEKKDDAMIASAIGPPTGTGGGSPAAVTAAARAAAPAAAAEAAPPAADVAVPPAVAAELDRRGVTDPDKPKE